MRGYHPELMNSGHYPSNYMYPMGGAYSHHPSYLPHPGSMPPPPPPPQMDGYSMAPPGPPPSGSSNSVWDGSTPVSSTNINSPGRNWSGQQVHIKIEIHVHV